MSYNFLLRLLRGLRVRQNYFERSGDRMDLCDFDLNALSSLKYRIRTCDFGGKWSPTAVVLEFSGTYRWGSQGNADADFIAAIKAAALEILHVQAVVFDFRCMSYEWGNRIWNVLPCREPGGDLLPAAIVVGDPCRKGFSSCAGMVPPTFESLDDALRFVEIPARESINELMKDVE
jgi:hypothetical protein